MYTVFASLLAERIKENNLDIDYITYVPISKNRYKERGYNQSKLIAKALSTHICGKVVEILLKKVDNQRQSTLSLEERKKNIQNVFEIISSIDKFKGKNILLIDDIYTTGETINECVKTMQRCITESKIYVAVVAMNNKNLIEVR